jgi:hypothetical protein
MRSPSVRAWPPSLSWNTIAIWEGAVAEELGARGRIRRTVGPMGRIDGPVADQAAVLRPAHKATSRRRGRQTSLQATAPEAASHHALNLDAGDWLT